MTSATESMLDKAPLLMLIDGHALVHRAFHAFREPLDRAAELGRGSLGGLRFPQHAPCGPGRTGEPTHCAIAFDLPRSHFPARRVRGVQGAPASHSSRSFRAQFDRVRQLVSRIRNPDFRGGGLRGRRRARRTLCKPGRGQRRSRRLSYPATATCSSSCRRWFASSWRPPCGVRRCTTWPQCASATAAWDRRRVPDIKAIQGDTSDNIPGVRGIGPKTRYSSCSPSSARWRASTRSLEEVTPVQVSEGAAGQPARRRPATSGSPPSRGTCR